MADYSDLLARLGAGLPYRAVPTTDAERQADPAVIKNVIDEDALRAELAECASAIRALIAERDAAVLAEREACASYRLIADEIVEIMRAREDGADTPGGLEHMGDVWRLLVRWLNLIRARGEKS